jgi:Uncharacterized protein conserved in bacteria
MKALIDINLPKRLSERLKSMGFDVVYLSEVLSPDTKDEIIAAWMEKNDALILTRDKRFPATKGGKKIILARLSPERLTNEAVLKLIILGYLPEEFEDSAEINVFASFLRNRKKDPFFDALK